MSILNSLPQKGLALQILGQSQVHAAQVVQKPTS